MPKYEFRGAWIATVVNLDWPVRGAAPAGQQAALRTMLDGLQAAGINAVFFQIRSESDALYASDLEPWSYWLTGEQGRAPEPFYDPLAFAVEEAHARGMELHAWFNPFRAERAIGTYELDEQHLAGRHPEWTLTIGSIRILDPGLPDVRNHVAGVVADVVRRYDIDGVHFDDYFYPYPPNDIDNEDDITFAEYNRGFTDRHAWRRDNVDLFVAQVADSIDALRPSIKYGISPFGIWKNGEPAGIVGLDAYNVIYGDAVAWLEAERIDYLVPQLYWPFGGGQDYGTLAPWWASKMNGRHLYIGHGLYRADPATFSGTLYGAGEVPRQVRFNRAHPDIQGSVFFRAQNLTTLSSKGFADTLRTGLYRKPALTPPMPWKSQMPPGAPVALTYEWQNDTTLTLHWRPPETDEGAPEERYAVYRILSGDVPDFEAAIQQPGALIAVTADTFAVDTPGMAPDPHYYVVTAVSANSIDSPPSNPVVVDGRAVATEAGETPAEFTLYANYPNPFNPSTTLSFSLSAGQAVTLKVYDMMGRVVTTLIDGVFHQPGTHRVVWNGANAAGVEVASGTYLYALETPNGRQSRRMVLLR